MITFHTLCGCTKTVNMTGLDTSHPFIRIPIKVSPSMRFPEGTVWRVRKFRFKEYTGRWFKVAHFEEVWE